MNNGKITIRLASIPTKVIREVRGEQYQTPSTGIGLIERKSDRQILEEYLGEEETYT